MTVGIEECKWIHNGICVFFALRVVVRTRRKRGEKAKKGRGVVAIKNCRSEGGSLTYIPRPTQFYVDVFLNRSFKLDDSSVGQISSNENADSRMT